MICMHDTHGCLANTICNRVKKLRNLVWNSSKTQGWLNLEKVFQTVRAFVRGDKFSFSDLIIYEGNWELNLSVWMVAAKLTLGLIKLSKKIEKFSMYDKIKGWTSSPLDWNIHLKFDMAYLLVLLKQISLKDTWIYWKFLD